MPYLFVLQVPTLIPKIEKKLTGTKEVEFVPNPIIANIKNLLEHDQFVDSRHVNWVLTEDGKNYLCTFPCLENTSEPLMKALLGLGVAVQLEVTEEGLDEQNQEAVKKYNTGNLNILPLNVSIPQRETDVDPTFLDTVASRLMVETVIHNARAQAMFTFDYLCLVIVASIIAAFGLTINSPVIVVASMLVSPIMGPILAMTFGTIVQDWPLTTLGVKNELISLGLCVLVGFVVGLGVTPFYDLPTDEMASRGTPEGLLIGIFIALPSGVGVALSVLGNNTTSLVGVAISASLLPPAVNTGLSFAIAAIGPVLKGNEVVASELMIIGTLSLTLTLINILCVYLAALGMFKIKEIAPIPGKTQFWKRDVGAAREANKTLKHGEANEEWARAVNIILGDQETHLRPTYPQTIHNIIANQSTASSTLMASYPVSSLQTFHNTTVPSANPNSEAVTNLMNLFSAPSATPRRHGRSPSGM